MKKLVPLFLTFAMTMMAATPASAVSFTPSVEQKEAPEVVTVTGDSGDDVAAVIQDAQGETVSEVPYGELIVTPVSQTSEADEDITTNLENAYTQITSVSSLLELSTDVEDVLYDYSLEVGDDVTVDDLVVRDLFDVTVRGEYADHLAVDGHSIAIRFSLNLDPSAFLMVLHNYQGDEWEVIPNDRVTRYDNGDVSVAFYSLSPVAFVVDGAEVALDPNAPQSPQTGEKTAVDPMVICAAVFGVAAVGLFLMGTRRKKA